MPPMPKPAATRQRRNRTSTASRLVADPKLKAPALPDLLDGWHPETTRWWADVWASPMAPEYDESDRHGLFALAALVNDFWTAEKPRDRALLAAEIRLQRQCFGLTPIDRRRLQWEIERGEEAAERGRRRRSAPVPKAETGKADPRRSLQAV